MITKWQATGSMCLRVALINFFNYICDNNLFGKVKITITPYDEINCEAPEAIAEEVANLNLFNSINLLLLKEYRINI